MMPKLKSKHITTDVLQGKEDYDKHSSSGYDTLSGQTTEWESSKVILGGTKSFDSNDSVSEEDTPASSAKIVNVRRRKQRCNRKSSPFHDTLEADVDSDTTVDSCQEDKREKPLIRRTVKKKHIKVPFSNNKPHGRSGNARIKRHNSDPGFRTEEIKTVVSGRSSHTTKNFNILSENCKLINLTTNLPSSFEVHRDIKCSDMDRTPDRVDFLKPVPVSGDELSENNSTAGYPSDTISSENSVLVTTSSGKHFNITGHDDREYFDSDSGVRDMNASLSSACTSSYLDKDCCARTESVTEDANFLLNKVRKESIQSYEHLIQRIDKKLKQTESCRTAEENKSLKADLLSIQEQIKAIKLTSTNRSAALEHNTAENEITNTGDKGEENLQEVEMLAQEAASRIACKSFINTPSSPVPQGRHLTCRDEGMNGPSASQFTKVKHGPCLVETKPPNCWYHAHGLSVESDHYVSHCNSDLVYSDKMYVEPRAKDVCSQQTFDEISRRQLVRRRSDPTGYRGRVVNNASSPLESEGDQDCKSVWFALYGRPIKSVLRAQANDFQPRPCGTSTPLGMPLQTTTSESIVREDVARGNWQRTELSSNDKNFGYVNEFVYPHGTVIGEHIVKNSTLPDEPKQRAVRIRYVDNWEDRPIMEGLSCANKRKKTDDHNATIDKEAKKPRSSLIKRVKASFNVRRALNKLKLHRNHKSTPTKRLDVSYTSQWVGVGSSGEEDSNEPRMQPMLREPSHVEHVSFGMEYRDRGVENLDESVDDPDFDPLAHLESNRSQRRGSLIKRFKKWYNARSKSVENVSAIDHLHERFEVLNISHSPRRLGSNGPLVNNVIRNRSRSEENLPTFAHSSRHSTPPYDMEESCRKTTSNSRVRKAESSQSLTDTKVVRFKDTSPVERPVSLFEGGQMVESSRYKQDRDFGYDYHSMAFRDFFYASHSLHNCPCCYCAQHMPPPNCHRKFEMPFYNRDMTSFGMTVSECGSCISEVPSCSSRRQLRSKPHKLTTYDLVVPPLQMTVTHEKKAQTRKLTAQHTFV